MSRSTALLPEQDLSTTRYEQYAWYFHGKNNTIINLLVFLA